MIQKTTFLVLFEKLKSKTITREEYNDFLTFVNASQNTEYVKNILTDDFEGYEIIEPKAAIRWILPTWLKVAAVALLICTSTFFIYNQYNKASNNNSLTPITYSTGPKPSELITLPDGSQVKLNSFTRITWNTADPTTRSITLDGEAFFHVIHTKNNTPFIVETKLSKIKVLGTSFNVNGNETEDKIFLEGGKIELIKKDNLSQKIILAPGESAFVSKQVQNIQLVKTNEIKNESIWKDGLLHFSGLKASEVIRRIGEVYNKKINITDNTILNKTLELTLPYNNWEITSAALALALGLETIPIH